MDVSEIVGFARQHGLDVVKVSAFKEGVAVNTKYCVYRVSPGCRRVLVGFRRQPKALHKFISRLVPVSAQGCEAARSAARALVLSIGHLTTESAR